MHWLGDARRRREALTWGAPGDHAEGEAVTVPTDEERVRAEVVLLSAQFRDARSEFCCNSLAETFIAEGAEKGICSIRPTLRTDACFAQRLRIERRELNRIDRVAEHFEEGCPRLRVRITDLVDLPKARAELLNVLSEFPYALAKRRRELFEMLVHHLKSARCSLHRLRRRDKGAFDDSLGVFGLPTVEPVALDSPFELQLCLGHYSTFAASAST